MNILDTIISHKKIEVATAKKIISPELMKQKAASALPTRGFYAHLLAKTKHKKTAIIAEVKQASPSSGIIRADFDHLKIAKSYAENGATCLSVLTDEEFFKGNIQHLIEVRQVVDLPILRKDFTIDTYQIYEARASGADAILLIAACLNDDHLRQFYDLATSLSLDVLVEVHNQNELDRALKIQAKIIGINNRNLATFKTSLQTTIDLSAHIDSDILLISESGISTKSDIKLLQKHGIYAYLIGEAFMRQPNPGTALKEIFG